MLERHIHSMYAGRSFDGNDGGDDSGDPDADDKKPEIGENYRPPEVQQVPATQEKPERKPIGYGRFGLPDIGPKNNGPNDYGLN